MNALLQQFSDAMADTYGGVQRSLIQLRDRRGSIGAGTVWHADGLIVTNAHVVLDYPQVPHPGPGYARGHGRKRRHRDLHVVLRDGSEHPARLLAVDEANDLAALAVDADNLPVITPGNSRLLRPGQWVMALGHPWGVPDALTAGVVIAMGGDLPEMQTGREWIALNLRLRPGHSGGPLVDTQGRLVGINTLITGPEVGFAIPVHTVTSFLKQTLGSRVEHHPTPMFV
jgi:S1-C subfamily serine protease